MVVYLLGLFVVGEGVPVGVGKVYDMFGEGVPTLCYGVPMPKSNRSMRIDDELWAKAQGQADRLGISMSAYVSVLIAEYRVRGVAADPGVGRVSPPRVERKPVAWEPAPWDVPRTVEENPAGLSNVDPFAAAAPEEHIA